MSFTPTDYQPYDFANRRHIGPSPAEMAEMLKVVGAKTLDDLIDQTIPKSIRQEKPLEFGRALSERELLYYIREVASKNQLFTSLIGQGYHGTVTPPVIQRNILENPAWYTAYTPYQPEISQGRLEALLNYQTMICDLTGLPVANASLLDEGTAAAEAMAMAQRVSKSKATAFFVDQECHPQNIAVMKTRAAPLGIEIVVADPADLDAEAVFGAVFQYPGTRGHLMDFTGAIEALHAAKAVGIVIADPAGVDAVEGTGRDGGGHRRRLDSAVRGADGLWRAARCLYGLFGCDEADDAGAAGGRVDRCARQQGIPAEPADPRTAYSARKGDLECLHGAGIAGGDGQFLCGVSWAGRAQSDRSAGASESRSSGRGIGGRRLQSLAQVIL